MSFARRTITLVTTTLLFFSLVAAPAAQAAPTTPTECSDDYYQDDRRLGPEELPTQGDVGAQLIGYDRTGNRPVDTFLFTFYDDSAGSWRYPPNDGYAIGPNGQPLRSEVTLRTGSRIDRYGSEYGAFLAPMGIPYTSRAIPPSNLVGTPAQDCNYFVYEVLRSFEVNAGPIAPWFFQTGGGTQYQLNGELVPGAPASLSVKWLLDNRYLARLS